MLNFIKEWKKRKAHESCLLYVKKGSKVFFHYHSDYQLIVYRKVCVDDFVYFIDQLL